MTTYVALLRGINIGSKKRIKMDALRALIESLGFDNPRTYVNSGNVVFTTSNGPSNRDLAAIETALRDQHDLDVPVVVRTGAELADVFAANPFPQVEATPKLLHVSFLSEVPEPALVDALAQADRGDDEYRVVGPNIYLHYPHGLSKATFMLNGFDRALKVASTSRNWNTVVKLAEMSRE